MAKHPPKFARWLLEHVSDTPEKLSIIGDMEEEFEEISTNQGNLLAFFWYLKQTSFILFSYLFNSIFWGTIMLKNYLKVALRNIRKNKVYSFINIFGLAIGLACCFMILLWVQDELGYDAFHENSENLYRIVTEGHYSGSVRHFSATPAPLGPALEDEIPEIVNMARSTYPVKILIKKGDAKFYESGIRFVDPAFVDMFSFPLLKGDPKTALNDPYSIVLTEEMAHKYFGSENPVGKTLNLGDDQVKVTGVLKNIPTDTHLQFDFILPFELVVIRGNRVHWGGHFYQTYIQLQQNDSFEKLSNMLPEWTKNHTREPVVYYLQPITAIHLHDLGGGGPIIYVYIFSAIAFFVLFVACINFMNLSTAKSMGRSKEIGLRKVVGANRNNIVRQFFGESVLITFVSFILALFIVLLLLPEFNNLADKELSIADIVNFKTIFLILVIVVLTGIISGSYPALFLSAFRPVAVLSEKASQGKGGALFRKVLVVVQFSLSIMLIIGTTIIYSQMQFIRNKNLGFDKELLVCLPIRGNMGTSFESMKAQLLQNANIKSVTAGSAMPAGPINSEWGQINWEGKDPDTVIPMNHIAVDENYLKTFGMNLVRGRDFSREFSTDTLNFILNEAAVKATGLQEPLGKKFTLLFRTGTIVGVVKNFHHYSLRRDITPLIIRNTPDRFWNFIFVRLAPNQQNMVATMNFLKSAWNDYAPQYPFEYEFLDQRINELYRTEERTGTIFRYFTILIVFIACLGLFGLASFTAERKTKEIGIRKVLGARASGIVFLLSREFTKLILFANVIAWPIAFLAMNKWLRAFSYRTEISILAFILPGILAVIIAILTVSLQAYKAAVTNPVQSLRNE